MESDDKRAGYRIHDLIDVIFSIATTISLITTGVALGTKSVSGFTMWLCITLGIALIAAVFTAIRLGRVSMNRFKAFSIQFHKFTELMRDNYYDLENKQAKGELTIPYITERMKETLKDSLDYLCRILNASTGKEINACIKVLLLNQYDETVLNEDNAYVKTLCRDRNSDSTREVSQIKHKVFENTDFNKILFEECPDNCFYSGNLKAYSSNLVKTGQIYKNSDKYWSRHYIGTIVCPIRIKNQYLHYKAIDDDYYVIGFLCVDSKSPDAFREQEPYKRYNMNTVKAFADGIFTFLEKCSFFLDKAADRSNIK